MPHFFNLKNNKENATADHGETPLEGPHAIKHWGSKLNFEAPNFYENN